MSLEACVQIAYCDRKAAADTNYVKTVTAKIRWYNEKHKRGDGMWACLRYVFLRLL